MPRDLAKLLPIPGCTLQTYRFGDPCKNDEPIDIELLAFPKGTEGSFDLAVQWADRVGISRIDSHRSQLLHDLARIWTRPGVHQFVMTQEIPEPDLPAKTYFIVASPDVKAPSFDSVPVFAFNQKARFAERETWFAFWNPNPMDEPVL